METATLNPLHAPDIVPSSSGTNDVTTTTAPGSDWMVTKHDDYTQALTREEEEVHPVVVSSSGGHDDHHAEIAPTKVPEWIGNIIEKVFKVKKRGTTVEMECYCGVVPTFGC